MLFHVQDTEREAFVIANNYGEALSKWEEAVKKENDRETWIPRGISYICGDDDLILEDGFVDPI
jgi:hypothetical protein